MSTFNSPQVEESPLLDLPPMTRPPAPHKRRILALLAVALAAVIAVVALVSTFPPPPPTQYGVVIDAGSSGTRLHVYQWVQRVSPFSIPDLHEEDLSETVSKISTGISSFATDPQGVRSMIQDLLKVAEDTVPPHATPKTPLALIATAGMRLLPQHQQDDILDAINDVMADSPFPTFKDHPFARVCSGQEEGVFGWVASNILDGKLRASDPVPKHHQDREQKTPETVGAIDMGGASMQMTFHSTKAQQPNAVQVTIGGQDYDLYSHSFLGLGRNQAYDRYVTILANTTTRLPSQVNSPCHLRGFRGEAPPIKSDNGTLPGKMMLIGSGDWAACQALMAAVSGHNQCARGGDPSCTFFGVVQPPVGNVLRFDAFSTFRYTKDFLGGPTHVGRTSEVSAYVQLARAMYGYNQTEAQAYYGDSPFFNDESFNAAYTSYVLGADGLRVAPLKVAFGTGSDVSLSWALGVMMLEAERNAVYAPEIANTPTVLTPVVILGVVAGLAVCAAVAIRLRGRPRHGGAQYSALNPDAGVV